MDDTGDTGGPAFPVTDYCDEKPSGMTLRDYFAGQALAGLLHTPPFDAETNARIAYQVADAMLAERAK